MYRPSINNDRAADLAAKVGRLYRQWWKSHPGASIQAGTA